MPSRSRTKPGSTNRRPKVAGLRQHALAGTAPGRPGPDPDDTLAGVDTVEAPDTVDAPADDRVSEASTSDGSAPGEPTTTADVGETSEADDGPTDVAPAAETTALPTTPATEDSAGGADADVAASATDSAGAATADGTKAPADTPAPAAETTDTADTAATTAADATATTDTAATDGKTSGTTTAATTTATTAAPSRKRKRGTGLAPRPEATAPTRERGRRDTGATATPTRTAKPTRTGGRRTEPETETAPGRLAGVRGAVGRFGRSRALPVTLVVVTVVCLVLAGLAFWQGREAWTEGPVANDAVVDVGGTAELVGQSREAVEKIFSYDFTRLDDSVDAARTMSSNPFTDRYLQVFDQTIRVPAQEQQLKQTATVVNIGVMTMQDDRAEVMALAQFSAQRTTTGQSTNAPGLLRLQMERIDGRWKLAELTPLTAPPPAPR